MKNYSYEIGIAGAGASGCAAALTAEKLLKADGRNVSIALLEKNEYIMKKVIASGNGRCNISNTGCDTSQEVLSFLEEYGIYTVIEEEGRIYPRTRYSRTVSDHFEQAISESDIDLFTDCEIEEVGREEEGFLVRTKKGIFHFQKLLIAMGGKAGPQFGTSGDSYRFLRKLGHTVTTLRPSLTALECEGVAEKLKGIRAEAVVTLLKNGKPVCQPETGEVQFTKDGLSGICVMNLSRHLLLDRNVPMDEAYRRFQVELDLAPDMDEKQIGEIFSKREEKGETDREILKSFVRDGLAEYLNGRDKLKECIFTVTGSRGWRDAQVTAGGISRGEMNDQTMESLIIPNLFVTGEALDYDGPCGGYNLNHAWITGIRAGKAMAECIE